MQHSQIECDAHNLLDEANVLLLTGRSDPAKTNDLVEKIRACAAQARESGWSDIAQRLLEVGERMLTSLAQRREQPSNRLETQNDFGMSQNS